VNVNVIGLTLVIEPLVTVVDVIVMVGGGTAKSTLLFPKKNWFVPVKKVKLPLIVCCCFMVTVRLEEVLAKALVSIVVTEAGMFMDVNLVQYRKQSVPIDVTDVPIVTEVKPQFLKALKLILMTELGIVTDLKFILLQ
jgi:hypothetical protein